MADSPYECAVCSGDFTGTRESVDGSEVCPGCISCHIIPQFRDALAFEANYPVTFGSGGGVLDPADFQSYFEDWDDFREAWTQKLEEYNIPASTRLYCKVCSVFLGKKSESSDGTVCKKCDTKLCGKCGERSEGHISCESDDPFRGFTDVKNCPGCGTPRYLYVQLSHAITLGGVEMLIGP